MPSVLALVDGVPTQITVSGGGNPLHTGASPPADPADQPLWWDSSNGRLYVYYNDGDSSQWVAVTPAVTGGEGGGGGGGEGIALTDLSVGTPGTPSGNGSLSYVDTTGVFTYTPPDLSAYLTSFTETDPTVGAHIKAISSGQITNWDTAFGWGNHAGAGYLTSAAIGVTVQGYSANLAGWSAIATSTKQDTLVSGTSIKTINSESLLGSGNIVIDGGGIALTDLSVGTPATPSGNGSLSYVNTTGVFTYTPPDLSAFLTEETDPTVGAHIKAISSGQITNWDTAFGWGNHASAGYLTAAAIGVTVQGYSANLAGWSAIATSTKQDTLVSGTSIKTINSESLLGSGNIAISGGIALTDLSVGTPATPSGNGSLSYVNTTGVFTYTPPDLSAYLTSFTETDPTVGAHIKAISSGQITNWDTAFGWGNHASAGYLTSAAIGVTVQGYSANLAGWSAIATSTKQDTLVSGTNIRTVQGQSIVGSGNTDVIVVSSTEPGSPFTGMLWLDIS